MLSHLLIQNYALIETLELSPEASLNIITGETGAGKSIMLGALGLLMGNRADTKALYNEADKCIIEGTFDVSGFYLQNIFDDEGLDYENTCIVRREISPTGKSRAFINDSPVTLETMRRICSNLMDIHSQHDSILLGSNDYQLQLIDTYAQTQDKLLTYQAAYQNYKKLQVTFEQMQAEAAENKKEFDFINFQLDELIKAKLEAKEQEQLEQEANVLEHAEEVKQKLQNSLASLQDGDVAVMPSLQNILGNLNSIAGYSIDYKLFKDRIQSCSIELKDLIKDIEATEEKIELDGERIAIVQERLDFIYKLQKKHAVNSNQALLDIQATLNEKVRSVINLNDDLSAAKAVADEAKKNAQALAEDLSDSRQKVFETMQNRIEFLLIEMGILNATLKIVHQPTSLSIQGIDTINFMFSANKGIQPRQLKEVASGGEFSRLMLAIKYLLAEKRALPTIIFDEIDTGISGEIAIKVGKLMKEMSKNIQVIAITHLHQLAGKGDAHFFVYKDNSASRTVSRIRKLNNDERIIEIAKMIGGENPSESSITHAIELLEIN